MRSSVFCWPTTKGMFITRAASKRSYSKQVSKHMRAAKNARTFWPTSPSKKSQHRTVIWYLFCPLDSSGNIGAILGLLGHNRLCYWPWASLKVRNQNRGKARHYAQQLRGCGKKKKWKTMEINFCTQCGEKNYKNFIFNIFNKKNKNKRNVTKHVRGEK